MGAGPLRRCLATVALRRVRVRVLGGMLVVRLLFVFVLVAFVFEQVRMCPVPYSSQRKNLMVKLHL